MEKACWRPGNDNEMRLPSRSMPIYVWLPARLPTLLLCYWLLLVEEGQDGTIDPVV